MRASPRLARSGRRRPRGARCLVVTRLRRRGEHDRAGRPGAAGAPSAGPVAAPHGAPAGTGRAVTAAGLGAVLFWALAVGDGGPAADPAGLPASGRLVEWGPAATLAGRSRPWGRSGRWSSPRCCYRSGAGADRGVAAGPPRHDGVGAGVGGGHRARRAPDPQPAPGHRPDGALLGVGSGSSSRTPGGACGPAGRGARRRRRGHRARSTVVGARVLLAVALTALVLPVVLSGHSSAARTTSPPSAPSASTSSPRRSGSAVCSRSSSTDEGRGADPGRAAVQPAGAGLLRGHRALRRPRRLAGAGRHRRGARRPRHRLRRAAGRQDRRPGRCSALLGWQHRRRTLPRLRAGEGGAFRRFAAGEVLLMLATVAVAVALAASPPPAEAAPAAAEPGTSLSGPPAERRRTPWPATTTASSPSASSSTTSGSTSPARWPQVRGSPCSTAATRR